jgi:RNA polymerase sigma factor for flagellar operon FliA
MRQQDWAPVHIRARIRQIEAAYDQISQEKGHPATDTDVARLLGIDLEELRQMLSDAHFLNILHLEDLLTESSDEDTAISSEANFDRAFEKRELQDSGQEFKRLSEREQSSLTFIL